MLQITRSDACLLNASALLAHVKAMPGIYKALTGGPEAGGGPRVLKECFESRVREALASRSTGGDRGQGINLQNTMVARFVASSLFVVIECWLEKGMSESPEEVQTIFSRLVGRGLGDL